MSVRNLDKFNRDLQKAARDIVEEDFDQFIRKIAIDVLTGVVMKTPVDTGRARGDWQLTIGSPAGGQTGRGTDEKIGPKSTAAAQQLGQEVIGSELQNLALRSDPFATIFISNNLPYIIELEHGSSQQAPQGMVSVTLEEVRQEFGP